jgi:hypothetical protein
VSEVASTAAHVTADGPLARALAQRGVAAGQPEDALVLDASAAAPASWDELEAELVEAYRLSRRAVAAGAPVVYVVDGAAVYGHAPPLRAALASGLLGGARSLAAEGRRKGIPAHAVTVARADAGAAGPDADRSADAWSQAADAIAWLLRSRPPTGQLLHCDPTHVGRPPA